MPNQLNQMTLKMTPTWKLLSGIGLFLAFSISALGAESPQATPVQGPSPATPVPSEVKEPKITHPPKVRHARHTNRPTATVAVNRGGLEMSGQTRFVFDEARNLLVPNQKYFIKYEDEETYGRTASTEASSTSTTFSQEQVADFQKAVDTIGEYRNRMKTQCLGNSTRFFIDSLDHYFSSLAAFNRKAIPLVADISSNNNQLMLVVNRTALIDAPVLMSRYLQFKKQRFKETISRFAPSDTQLIKSLVNIAKMLKVEISEDDWNKTYGIRDSALELVSLWPREAIFEASEKLADAKETPCIVNLKAAEAQTIAAPSTTKTGE